MKATTAPTRPSSTRSRTEHLHRCPPSSQRLPLPSKASDSLALLFCDLSHGFCHNSWKQAAVGGAEQLSISPWECGRSAIHLACVEASSIWLYVKHLHPRAVGAAQAPPEATFPTIYLKRGLQPAEVPNCTTGRPGA